MSEQNSTVAHEVGLQPIKRDERIRELEQSLAHERQQRAAAETEVLQHRGACLDRRVDLVQYAAKLLALAEEQRRALEAIASTPGVRAPRVGGDYARNTARAALATDLDALVNAAKELGIDATTLAMAPETGNAPI